MSAPIVTPNIETPKPAEQMSQDELLAAANALRASQAPPAPVAAADDVPTAAPGTGAPAPVVPAAATPAPLPKGFSEYEVRPDGTIHTKLVTGQVFDGTPLEVAQKIGSSKVDTEQFLAEVRAKVDAGATPAAATAAAAQAMPEVAASLAAMTPEQFSDLYYQSLNDPGKATAMALARELEFDDVDEMKDTLKALRATHEVSQANMVASEFARQRPDFPFTEAARDKLYGVLEKAGMPESLDALIVAHDYCIKNNLYEPRAAETATVTTTSTTSRPVPPPIVASRATPGGMPDVSKMTPAQIEQLAAQIRHGG